MPTERSIEEVAEVEGSLALREANRKRILSEPIPHWPEKASGLLSLLFVIFVTYAPEDSVVSKTIIIFTFVGAMSCVWFTTSKLRQKLEALSHGG